MGSHVGSLFSKLSSWHSMIKQASIHGKWREVLSGYCEMQRSGHRLDDPFTLPVVLKACAKLSWLFHGRCIHGSLIKRGLDSSISVGNSIADFYIKCEDLSSAIREFDSMRWRDSVTWNIIVFGLLDRGFAEEGLWWFSKSRAWGFEPNVSSIILVIHAFRNLGRHLDGEKIYGYVIRSGFMNIPSVQNSILSMYAEFDCTESARNLFDEMSERDVISWSVMIGSYVRNQDPLIGLQFFQKMVHEGETEPDGVTVTTVLKACAVMEDIEFGRSVHGFVIRKGLGFADEFVGNSLIDMYSKSGDIDSASRVFHEMSDRNIVSWNSILSGFVRNERYNEALLLYRMMERVAIDGDEATLVSLLQVCKFLELPLQIKSIHCVIIRYGYETNEQLSSSLIDSYTNFNLVDQARILFDAMTCKDVVSWSTMISGFARSGRPDEAISIFRRMGDIPNAITVTNLLDACSVTADLRISKWAHGIAVRRGFTTVNASVATALVDAYAKCGSIDIAKRAFNQIPTKNVVSWTALISAYAMNGLPDQALAALDEMKQHGVAPNSITYLSALSACSHGGLIEQGLGIFHSMIQDHGKVKPWMSPHYSCIVDMLSRAGEVEKALEFVKNLPEDVNAGVSTWGAVLSGCRSHGRSEITSEVVTEVLELEPSCSSGYLLASKAFAAEKLWDNAATMRRLVKQRRVRVVAGYSMVHVGKVSRRFMAGEKEVGLSDDFEINDVVWRLHECMEIDETWDGY
ncbi:PREDICTED: pentatricopeptide repeat-containing protein At2g17210 isoform X2 [Tarenaya hassleriana]|uniref:pentatricopeptide repeat-containing protein At2g17210 isoform X1 n=1 Tax=Tarenaya hassleriana TaxID=28532 RepID=UPI00053C975E|nr:PREDICTED: pentatricopeptide repeat-containing protein At2g17210 isoform X1 [Tarenaya hassleriana]XP_010530958.1 PREDICTED: pentatricopeptide repeat-containing protein At2g17210 isoform X2 [Tarenaya hassleriana]